MTPAVSVIVPVYKAEATLDACVESILAQTFPDFELLLIDDESPDRCPEMCDAWAKKDPRIRVLHPAKAGPGPSGARNAGVQAAAAPWLTMVDSDDTIAPDLVEKLLAGAETIREVIPFPMNKNAQDVMMGAPGKVDQKQLDELHIACTKVEE